MKALTDKLETNWQSIVLFYVLAILLIVVGAVISPTNMAGVGIDLLVALIVVIINIVFLFRSGFKLIAHGKTYLIPFILHGLVFITWFGSIAFTITYAAITSSK